jgi:hypothetical protein
MVHVLNKIATSFLTICALAALASCGPGTGGTGTGPILTATSSQLTDSAVTGNWATQDARTSVLIEVDKITVTSNCVRFTFIGNWVLDANQRIVRQTQENNLVLTFANPQMGFAITNAISETVASGTALTKNAPLISPACPN